MYPFCCVGLVRRCERHLKLLAPAAPPELVGEKPPAAAFAVVLLGTEPVPTALPQGLMKETTSSSIYGRTRRNRTTCSRCNF